jgi:hypothetical protein
MNEQEESCDPVDFIDPEEATLQELYYLAERGVPKAKEIIERYDKEVDILMAEEAIKKSMQVTWTEV